MMTKSQTTASRPKAFGLLVVGALALPALYFTTTSTEANLNARPVAAHGSPTSDTLELRRLHGNPNQRNQESFALRDGAYRLLPVGAHDEPATSSEAASATFRDSGLASPSALADPDVKLARCQMMGAAPRLAWVISVAERDGLPPASGPANRPTGAESPAVTENLVMFVDAQDGAMISVLNDTSYEASL